MAVRGVATSVVPALRCSFARLSATQDRNHQLHEEVRWHEAQQLNNATFAVPDSRGAAKRRPPTATTA
jgi:hypothetical protein